MGTTPTYAIPYPELTDPPDGAGQMKALAEAVDATIKGINEAPVLRAGRTTTQSFPTGSTPNPIGFTTIYEDPLAMANAGGTAFTIKKAGIWTISAAAGFVFNATGPRFLTIMIRALVPNPVIVDRLHDAGLLHYAFDVAGCGCRGYARAGYMTLHSFRNLAAITGVGHGMAATG